MQNKKLIIYRGCYTLLKYYQRNMLFPTRSKFGLNSIIEWLQPSTEPLKTHKKILKLRRLFYSSFPLML